MSEQTVSTLGEPATNEAWHTALLLPERYAVERWECVRGNYGRDEYRIWVTSEDIPAVEFPTHLTELRVSLVYHSETNEDYTQRTVRLQRIDFSYWDGEHWQTIEGKDEENAPSRTFAIEPYVPPVAQEDTVKVYPHHAIPEHAVTLELYTDTPYEVCYHSISAKRALSLLEQLEKERPTLEQMAKEQAS